MYYKFLFSVLVVFLMPKMNARQVIGFLDVANSDQGIQGWALDPDNPNASIQIHFYANAPAGVSGSVLIGTVTANQTRPDVNSATGYSGNHGFYWSFPINLTTPCPIKIYAYGIDLNGEANPNLSNSPRLVTISNKSISKTVFGNSMTISANSQFAGAIYSLKWKGKEFINSDDHGRLLQSASSFYDFVGSWMPECYNPTEAGSDDNGNSTCTDSRIINFTNANNILYSKTQMAYFAWPNKGTESCPSPKNTIVTSFHTLERTAEVNVPNFENVIKYKTSFFIPQSENHLGMAQFEAVTGYLNAEFNTFFHYDKNTNTLTQQQNDGEYSKPVVFSTADGLYAMGVYTPEISNNPPWGNQYAQFSFGNTKKWSVVRRFLNIQNNTTFTFYTYICIGNLEQVKNTMNQLMQTYPNN